MIKRSKTRYAVLGALSLGPSHGYDIRRELDATVGHFWNESFGQIYPILAQLAAEGHATVRSEKPDGGPERNVYAITPKGRRELRRWLAEPMATPARPRNELLLKLFFSAGLPRTVSIGNIAAHRHHLQGLLQRYDRIEAELTGTLADDPGLRFWLATLRHGQLLATAGLRWCDETTRALTELPPAMSSSPDRTAEP